MAWIGGFAATFSPLRPQRSSPMKPTLSRARRAAREPRKGGLAAAATAATTGPPASARSTSRCRGSGKAVSGPRSSWRPRPSQDAVGTAIREAATTGRSGRLLKLLGSPPLPERSVRGAGLRRSPAAIRPRLGWRPRDGLTTVPPSNWRSGRHGPPTSTRTIGTPTSLIHLSTIWTYDHPHEDWVARR